MPEDEEVCTLCGKVLGVLMSHNASNVCSLPSESPGNDWWTRREIILDILSNHFMPTFLTDRILTFHDNLRREIKSTAYNLMESLAYSTYAILHEEKIPRTPTEIAWYFGIRPSKIHQIEKTRPCQNETDARFILPRILSDLKIPFQYTEMIEIEIGKIQKVSMARPETLAGCAILRACKKTPYRDLKLADIANACGASHASIRSLNSKARKLI